MIFGPKFTGDPVDTPQKFFLNTEMVKLYGKDDKDIKKIMQHIDRDYLRKLDTFTVLRVVNNEKKYDTL